MLASVMQMQLLPAVLALAAFLVAILLTLYIVRMLFGRRIRVSGGRNRPKRLDIVDAFDLDRERQLVIVRRDNVEHLLLIGGPSDVLIEASFERPAGLQAETKQDGREPRLSAPSPSWPSPPERDEEAEEAPLAARGAAGRIPSPSPAPREAPGAGPLSVEGLKRRFPEPPRPAPRPPKKAATPRPKRASAPRKTTRTKRSTR
jgi:flagellar protein FliO/FliZ